MSDDKELEWPEGWRWYRNPPNYGGEPYLAHPHDCELTPNHIRRLVAFHGLALVPAADVPTPEERAVLEACRELHIVAPLGMSTAYVPPQSMAGLGRLLHAELARRAAKERKG